MIRPIVTGLAERSIEKVLIPNLYHLPNYGGIFHCVYMSKKEGGHINHDAHLWGSLFGLVYTIILIAALQPQLFTDILEQLKHPSLLGND